MGIGAAAVVLGVGLFNLYMPVMPGRLTMEPWILFGLWWVIVLVLFLRAPAGISAGPQGEENVLAAARGRKRG